MKSKMVKQSAPARMVRKGMTKSASKKALSKQK
jgi:hypothetical protein